MASGGCAPASTSGSAGGGIAGTKTVSASLWWDSFVALSDDLDRAAASPSAAISDALAKRIKGHHAWLRGSVSMFGKPNDASRTALDVSQVAVGEHRLAVKHDLKEAALHVSKSLKLDEVQSYILVKRSSESTPTTHDADTEEFLRLVSLQYYLERQCLLKCIRRIFVHAVCTDDDSESADAIKEEATILTGEKMEQRLVSIIEDSLAAAFSVKSVCYTQLLLIL
jgi:nuclear pore complex protein Nup188